MSNRRNSTVELCRQSVQTILDAGKSQAERNRMGQFATPNVLAIDIARHVASLIPDRNAAIHFADPAIGSGSFFSAAMTVWGRRRIHSAVGIEIDPTVADAARDLWADTSLRMICDDFTKVVANGSCPPAPNLLLANPPYVRHHHMTRQEKERLQCLTRRLTGIEVNGLAGLYVYFLLLATAWMRSDGIAGWLIPSEFMDVNYGAALKHFFTDHVTLIRIHRFDPHDVQFDQALVSSVVLVFRKTPAPADHAVEFTFGGTLAEPSARTVVPLEQLRQARKWTIYPSHPTNDRYTLSRGNDLTLGDFFRIQRGIATGSNKFFILDRAHAMRLGLPDQYLCPILPSPRYLKQTEINPDKDGYPLIDPQLCVIDCDLSEDVLKQRHPTFWKYLQTADALGIMNGYLIGKRAPWYRQEQRKPAPFLCTYMGRGTNEKHPFRFILNRSHAIATNLYLMLYPKPALADMLRKYPQRTQDVHEILRRVTGHELRGEGRVYGGGLHKIEPRELGRIRAKEFADRWPQLADRIESSPTPMLFN
ncbi:MAG: Eco57I restriction-modification methylase domain-containing protein [Phycisphaerales bacterium]